MGRASTSAAVDQDDWRPSSVPQHVAIIMDGNGRWAQQHGLPRLEGHRAGTENIRRILKAFAVRRAQYVTLYAFSTENWGRPKNEVSGLIEILSQMVEVEVPQLHEQNVRLQHLGRREHLPPGLAEAIDRALELTANNSGVTLCVAFDYGGRAEIVDAMRQAMADGVSPELATEELIRLHMYLPDVPDPDLVIRTGGERRLSNFLLWQAAYSELYFTDCLWPDFDDAEVERALNDYSRRQRRFGKLLSEA
ncbi:MAG: polyprenyl diphosphate synthase [Chloroflexi bacterium]|nr:polyprenyl diphosphate synthase [Chloroflexota bacterium]